MKCEEQGQGIQCDPEMLALFTSEPDSEEQKEEEIIDPRWEALRNIKNNY
ncbi:hypothetical protein KUH03_12225 [Sphingobacterium sp. E70]|nr:hypothetical protein [Sphingobacterium sp. E70]ULT27442.1 hypothetical protein KUH03_12225 [Sphingobacterium sp. E70]